MGRSKVCFLINLLHFQWWCNIDWLHSLCKYNTVSKPIDWNELLLSNIKCKVNDYKVLNSAYGGYLTTFL